MSTSWQGNNGQNYDKDGLPVNSGTDNNAGAGAQQHYDAFSQPQGQQAYAPQQQNYGQQQWGQPQYGQPQHGQIQQQQFSQPMGQPKSKIAAALLFFFLGELGIGNFYLGQNNLGIAKLILFFVGIVTAFFIIGFLILGALWIWKMVEFVMVLTGGGGYDRDARGVPLQ